MATNNSINVSTAGIVGFNGTAFVETTATNHAVLVGGATTSTFTNVGPTATAGQVLQSAGASADPAFSTAAYPLTAGTSGFVLTSNGTNFVSSALPGNTNIAEVTLTSAQIKALHGTPIQIVATPGAGKMICPLGPVYVKFTYGGTNVFVAGAAQNVSMYFGTTTLLTSAVNVSNSILVGSTSIISMQAISTLSNQALTVFENQPINAYNANVTEISGNAANDNTITFTFYYFIGNI
jgi:hypothetical protein